MFEKWQGDRDIHVGSILEDGSLIEGKLGSFSRESDDSPNRDLILSPPIRYRPPGVDDLETSPYEGGAVCFSAARIVAMFVSYSEKDAVTSSSAVGARWDWRRRVAGVVARPRPAPRGISPAARSQ